MPACPVCGIDEAGLSVGDATDAIRTFPRRYREALDGVPAALRLERPSGEAASMVGYAALARAGLAVLAGYLPAVLTGSEPAFAPDPASEVGPAAPPADAADGGPDAEGVLAGIATACDALLAQITEVPLAAWDRPFTVGDEHHRAIWVPRRAAHLGAHRLRDIGRVRARVAD